MSETQTRSRIDIPREAIAAFCRRHHIRRLALFGSVLRDDFRPDSDIDVLVEFEPGHTPGFAFFAMEDELSRIFGRKVDLNTPNFSADISGTRCCARPSRSMSRRDDLVRLRDMLDHARLAVGFTTGRAQGDLKSDAMLALACLRALEIVGEAASRISPEFRDAHPELSWREMIAMRNRLIHAVRRCRCRHRLVRLS